MIPFGKKGEVSKPSSKSPLYNIVKLRPKLLKLLKPDGQTDGRRVIQYPLPQQVATGDKNIFQTRNKSHCILTQNGIAIPVHFNFFRVHMFTKHAGQSIYISSKSVSLLVSASL